jgi:hypothetical protein
MNLSAFTLDAGAFGAFAMIFAIVPMILWLVIGWRAMRAHEEIASSLDSLSRHLRLRDESLRGEQAPAPKTPRT